MKPLPGKKDGPRVAIVLGGLGVSANVTQQAMEKLPGAVTFALRPTARCRAPGDERPRRGPRGAAAGADGAVRLSRQRSRPADAADLAQPRAKSRPPALADEPLPGLRRHRQLHGRALHLDRSRSRAGAAGNRAARTDLYRRRRVAAQPRRPDRRRQQPAVRQGRDRPRRGADDRRISTGRWASSRRWRANAAARSASPRHCRLRSIASRNGPRPPKPAASCWCRSPRSRSSRSRADATRRAKRRVVRHETRRRRRSLRSPIDPAIHVLF